MTICALNPGVAKTPVLRGRFHGGWYLGLPICQFCVSYRCVWGWVFSLHRFLFEALAVCARLHRSALSESANTVKRRTVALARKRWIDPLI